ARPPQCGVNVQAVPARTLEDLYDLRDGYGVLGDGAVRVDRGGHRYGDTGICHERRAASPSIPSAAASGRRTRRAQPLDLLRRVTQAGQYFVRVLPGSRRRPTDTEAEIAHLYRAAQLPGRLPAGRRLPPGRAGHH